MPKKKDLNSILIIGSGPIVLVNACEVRLMQVHTGIKESSKKKNTV